jgi:intergrase/recombinase
LNPRRPTPSGPKPDPFKLDPLRSIEKKDLRSLESGSSFKQDGGLMVSETLASRFLEWLDLPEDSKQYKEYRNNIKLLIGKKLDCETLHEFASKSKRKYETASRLLSFIASKRGLGHR